MNGAGGFAKIWRSVYGHVAFRDVAEEAAFIWMIGRAAWQSTRVRYKDRIIHLKRGQLALSQRDFCRGFQWSKGTYYRFIERLKTEAMIGADAGSGVTIITICNYDEYQQKPEPVGAPVGADVGAQAGHKRGTEQEREERKKESPLPPEGDGKTFLPKNWKAPEVAALPKMAREMAQQWPAGAYEQQAESFALWWHSERKMKTDWRATWANWIHRNHARVMQEARWKAGRVSDEPQPLWKTLA